MKLSAIQYKPPKAQTQMARAELLNLVERSAKLGADIIVCPEMAVSGYVFDSSEHLRPHAERADGPTSRALAKIAKAYNTWIVCGIAEEASDGTLYNSAVVLSSKEIWLPVIVRFCCMSWMKHGVRPEQNEC